MLPFDLLNAEIQDNLSAPNGFLKKKKKKKDQVYEKINKVIILRF
jgi:hypothetical protein